MRTVTDLPHKVTEDEHVPVPLPDGTTLAARIWRPEDSEQHPVPAVLEFIPYRKRDFTAPRDAIHHPYLAGHGYAAVRVDLRGSGESEGVLTDEYLEQELRDGEDVLAWLAEQPWCDGYAGMMGISWGGFNALQLAARRPPQLKAIATVCSTDDRYADDVHYMGGCLLGDNLSWASTMFAYNSCPPDPQLVGEQWRSMWLQRLEGSGLWLDEWLRHQTRDGYWRHGSICEDYSDVECAVLAVSGWADGYSNSVFRLMENLSSPRKGLFGPWSHKYPHLGRPGPAIGFLQELVRWWDRWLKGADNDVMDGPMVHTWMQDSVPPSTAYEQRPGRWVGEPSWPSPRIRTTEFPLGINRIGGPGEQPPEGTLRVESPLSVGQYAGKWCSYNAPPDLPYDQREEDGGSMVFDTDVLDERYEILGAPYVDLRVEVDRPVAMVAARLSDVFPDGRATRVTYGLLNLTHRDGHDRPRPLPVGEPFTVRVPLNACAQAFPPGHRIRLSLSTSYWPLAWPPPEPVNLVVHNADSCLTLPVRPPDPAGESGSGGRSPFQEPEGTPPPPRTQLRPGKERWQVSRDLVDYQSALEVVGDQGVVRFEDIDLELTKGSWERFSWVGDDFTSPRGETEWHIGFRRDGWDASTTTRTALTCDEENFHVHAELDAYERGERVFSRNWQRTIPRNCV
ncbi:MAG: CocE/NonD family hydrolase [Saccharopolyspora sp.]|uniref:CocE/NonD family hydrolase n=1 Tax=Saccharopolyspora sp. TaxID=33915 RepID=UPI0025EB7742|nr:CocE/NonD family hydrolase [Saccharopolyspora sp.]MBQ6640085.1 CocE/NonD family hydrolase [Saccharopolyspora sp.]